jgi:probable HAF family extracellular repeat protein
MVGLGDLDGSGFQSVAYGVNGDGSVAVGYGQSTSGIEAFRWTESAGMVGLGDIAGGAFHSEAYAVSADGLVVVGRGQSNDGVEAFRWTQGTGVIGLGDLPGGDFLSIAYGVNKNGSVIVGRSHTANGNEAFRWTEAGGIESIPQLLTDGGVNLGAWLLTEARGVSANGNIVAGIGRNPAGKGEAWWAKFGVGQAGFLSASALSDSLGDVEAIAVLAQQSIADDLYASLYADSSIACDVVDGLCVQGEDSLHKNEPGRGPSSQMTVVHVLDNGIRVGTRLHYDSYTDYMHGVTEQQRLGVSLVGSWQSEIGLRLFGAATSTRLRLDTSRTYLNGIDYSVSEGERGGRTFGAAVGLGWSFDSSGLLIMPHARYEYIRLTLDEYAEEGGTFPAEFYTLDHAMQVSRVGVESRLHIDDGLALDASAQWLHRLHGGVPTVAGRLTIFESGFALDSVPAQDDWIEARLGLAYKTSIANLRASVTASNQFYEPAWHASVGVGLQF